MRKPAMGEERGLHDCGGKGIYTGQRVKRPTGGHLMVLFLSTSKSQLFGALEVLRQVSKLCELVKL